VGKKSQEFGNKIFFCPSKSNCAFAQNRFQDFAGAGKNIWSVLILILFLCSFVSAKDIQINYPENVVVDEEFEISLKLVDFSEGVYDVKIEILGNGERIAQIYDEKWKSCYYYVKEAISDEEVFKLKINKDFSGEGDMIVKIRKGSSIDMFGDYKLNVGISSENIEEEIKDIKSEDADEEREEFERVEVTASVIEEVIEREKEVKSVEVIRLNSKSEEIVYESDSEKIKSFLMYSFLGFVLVFVVFVFIKNHKNKKYMELDEK